MKNNIEIKNNYRIIMKILIVIVFVVVGFISQNTNVEAKVKKNTHDVKALKQIIKQQRNRGAEVPRKMNAWTYKWDKKTGRLVKIDWENLNVNGKVDFNELKGLKNLKCGFNEITELKVNRLQKLEYLSCEKNRLKKLKLTRLVRLKSLECSNNNLKKLNLKKNVKLRYLRFHDNKIEEIDLTKLKKLRFLRCSDNQLKVLNLSKCDNIYNGINCSNNQIEKLKLKKHSTIDYIDCSNNQLETLNLDYIYEIQDIYCRNNKLKKLDFTYTDTSLLFQIEVDLDVEMIGLNEKKYIKKQRPFENPTYWIFEKDF